MNWLFHEAEARARSRLFFALENEGRKKLVEAFPHADLNRLPFREFVQNCVYAFKVEVNVTMERIKLYNLWYMEANESFLSFHSRLSAQAACCNWTEPAERSVVRDLFIGRIRDPDVQSTLIQKNPDADGTLKLALELEKGTSTSMEFQTILPHNKNNTSSFSLPKIKQEPAFSVQSRRGGGQSSSRKPNVSDKKGQSSSRSCYFCANTYSPDHRKNCPARDVECRTCKKKGHFAKVCNSRRTVNRVEEEEVQSNLETEIDNIVLDQDDDSEPEYGVLSITQRRIRHTVQICSLELLKSNRGTPRNLSVMLRSYGKSFFATVDTVIPVSFLNKRTADVLLQQNPTSRFISAYNMNDDISYVD